MADTPTTSWNEGAPVGSGDLSDGANKIREFKTQLREIITIDHKMDSSGNGSTWGYHKWARFIEIADLGSGAVGATILGSQTASGKGELVYVDEDDNDVQITSGGVLNVTAAAIAAIGADVDFGAYEVRAETFESDVATGTAPLTVASTTEVTNLKSADSGKVGGYTYDKTEIKPLGSWASKTIGTSYQATTDGFITCHSTYAVSTDHVKTYTGYSDSNNPATTKRVINFCGRDAGGKIFFNTSISFFVKKSDYYRVVTTNEVGSGGTFTEAMYFIPLGVA